MSDLISERKRILLVNVDSRWNLAIRRMYTYFTQQGHDVEMRDLCLSGYPHKRKVTIDACGYDQVYVSNIFENNAHRVTIEGCPEVIFGGVGSRDIDRKLPPEIEDSPPFYYPDEKTSYGFITRGCIRKCRFCKVPKHEGAIRMYNSLGSIIRDVPGERVDFLDNNILAHPLHMWVLDELVERGTRCKFSQGLDFRLVNDENLDALSKLNYIGEYIFAFDDPEYQSLLDRKIEQIKRYIPKPWKLKFYLYYHPDMDIGQLIDRVEWCRAHECLPYVMRDAACWESPLREFLIDYAAYCNQAGMFKKLTFEQFLMKRQISKERRARSLETYIQNGGVCAENGGAEDVRKAQE